MAVRKMILVSDWVVILALPLTSLEACGLLWLKDDTLLDESLTKDERNQRLVPLFFFFFPGGEEGVETGSQVALVSLKLTM